MEHEKVSCDLVTMSQLVWQMVTVTEYHITRVIWEPWESKHIATVVKYISSRELSENSIKFSLSNTEQRDSWLNSSHWTLAADSILLLSWLGKMAKSLFIFLFFSYLQLQDGAWESITWLCHNVTMVWWRVTDGQVTGHSHSVSHDKSNMRTMEEQAHSHSSKVYK